MSAEQQAQEDVVLAVLLDWSRCRWCGKYFDQRAGLAGLCSNDCFDEQFKVWETDFERWQELYNRFERRKEQ